MANFNDLIIATGGFGRYQLLLYFWYIVGCLIGAANNGFMVFGMLQPSNSLLNGSNTSNSGNYSFYSVAMEWSLYGDMEYVANLIISLQFAGMFFGPIIAGQISDRWGRKPAFYTFLTATITFRAVSCFSPGWQLFAALTSLMGTSFSALYTVQTVYFIEMIPAKWRLVSYALSWPLGYIWLAIAVKITGHWKPTTLVICSPYFILMPMWFLTCESPQWLMSKGRTAEARQVVQKIARFNRCSINNVEEVLDQVIPLEEEMKTDTKPALFISYWHLFYNRKATVNMVFLTSISVTAALVYYGLLFNTGKLAGDTSTNFIIIMCVRLMVNTSLPFLDRYLACLTRRRLYLCSYIGLSLSLAFKVIFLAIPTSSELTQSNLVTATSIFGMGASGLLWATIDMYSSELIPTLTRNMAAGFVNAISRIGSILAPQVILMYNLYPPSPFIVFLVVLSLSFFTAYPFIDETKGKPLPDLPDDFKTTKLSLATLFNCKK